MAIDDICKKYCRVEKVLGKLERQMSNIIMITEHKTIAQVRYVGPYDYCQDFKYIKAKQYCANLECIRYHVKNDKKLESEEYKG